jgi:hypothetical protein
MRWFPYWEEIQCWLNAKKHEFSQWETQGMKVNMKQSKDSYLHNDMHKIFFVEFPCLLYEWLKR